MNSFEQIHERRKRMREADFRIANNFINNNFEEVNPVVMNSLVRILEDYENYYIKYDD